MDKVGVICRQLQILRENSHLEIQYSITECYEHSYEKVIVYLNYDDDKNIDIKTEREEFKDIIEDSLLKNSGWYLVPSYTENKTNKRWFDHNNLVELS